jgi:hypothetical protein
VQALFIMSGDVPILEALVEQEYDTIKEIVIAAERRTNICFFLFANVSNISPFPPSLIKDKLTQKLQISTSKYFEPVLWMNFCLIDKNTNQRPPSVAQARPYYGLFWHREFMRVQRR